jgi:hypothetical protein
MHNYTQTFNVTLGWDLCSHVKNIFTLYAATHFSDGIFDLSTIRLKCLTLYYFSVCIAYFSHRQLIVLISVGSSFFFFCRFTVMPALFKIWNAPFNFVVDQAVLAEEMYICFSSYLTLYYVNHSSNPMIH